MAAVGAAFLGLLIVLFLCRPRAWLPVYLLLLPIAPQVEAAGVPISPTNAVFAAGLIAYVVRRACERRFTVALTPISLPTAILLISLFGSAMNAGILWGSHYGLLSLLKLARIAEAFLVFYLTLETWRDSPSPRLRPLIHTILVGAVGGAVLGAVSVARIDWFYSLYEAERNYGFMMSAPGFTFWRAVGVFLDPNHLSSYMVIALLLAAAVWPNRELRVNKPLIVVTVVACSVGLLLSFSRAGWLTLILGAGIYLLVSRQYRMAQKIRIAAAAALVLVLCVVAVSILVPGMSLALANRLLGSLDTASQGNWDVALSNRPNVWLQARQAVSQYPYFGIGYKMLPEMYIMGDNNYLTMLAEGGIVGATVFLFWLVCVTLALLRLARRHWMGELVFAVWVCFLLNMATVDIMTFWRTLPLFFALCGVAFAASAREGQGSGIHGI